MLTGGAHSDARYADSFDAEQLEADIEFLRQRWPDASIDRCMEAIAVLDHPGELRQTEGSNTARSGATGCTN